ncbi:MAG: hypothetical protein AB8B80_17125 [Marinicellaceae bacterium]
MINNITQRSQRRRKDSQRIFNYKTLSILVLLFFTTTLFSSESEVEESKNDFNLAQIIRSIALIYTDDKLDPEVEEFLNYKQEIIWEDNAFVYLWGMDKITDDPYKTGKEILVKLLEEDKLYDYEKHLYNSDFIDEYTNIEKLDHDLICSKIDKDCTNKVLIPSIDLKTIITENSKLIERYKEFTYFKHFKIISQLSYDNPWPSYRIITDSQKLFHLKLIENFNHSPVKTIIDELIMELNSLKLKLKDADTLISKMVILTMVSENIELFNIIIQKTNSTLYNYPTNILFKHLSPSEISIYSALFYEHYIGLKMVYDISVDIERINEEKFKYPTIQFLKILAFIGIKPNLTVNTQYHNVIKKLFEFSKLSQQEFYQKYYSEEIKANHDIIRNYYARVLIADVSTDFKSMYLEYQARLFDLDMKVQLLRLLIQSDSINNLKKGEEFLSSYDGTEPFIKDGKLCYSGLFNNNEKYRCLLILEK